MDSANLKTAAAYINNLLLARGLLRNGVPIDFVQLASPVAESKEANSKDAQPVDSNVTVTAQVINLVHDLILRRDRDQDHHESVAETLRTLRQEASSHNTIVSRLKTQNQDLNRQTATQASQLRTAHAATHAAEASARTLRDELGKTKAALTQVRSQCEKDIKRRDVQIQRLKSHLTTQQRGSNRGGVGTSLVSSSITITPGSSERSSDAHRTMNAEGPPPSLEDAEYSLKQETTEFLTELSQGLSDENDALIGLIRGTLATLKELQGIPEPQTYLARSNKQSARPISNHSSLQQNFVGDGAYENVDSNLVHTVQASYDSLSKEMENVLASLRDLLTNPSFAPIEEVHVREAEIRRLREGWEKMAGRWKEAVDMMDGWRKRLLRGGDTVNLDELKAGLGLGVGLGNVNGTNTNTPTYEEQEEDHNDADLEDDEAVVDPEVNVEDLPEEEPSFVEEEDAPMVMPRDRPSVEQGSPGLALQEGNVNIPPSPVSKQIVTSQQENLASAPSNTVDDEDDELAQDEPQHSPSKPAISNPKRTTSYKTTTSKLPTTRARQTSHTFRKSPAPPAATATTSKPQMSVEQKLRFAEEEARRVSLSSPTPAPTAVGSRKHVRERAVSQQQQDGAGIVAAGTKRAAGDKKETEEVVAVVKPVKRKVSAPTIKGRRRGRKSTLSPEELEELMGLAAEARTPA